MAIHEAQVSRALTDAGVCNLIIRREKKTTTIITQFRISLS